MAEDKKTIGITRDNQAALTELLESGRFTSELDAAKFAMAFAISSDAGPGRAVGADTKWNVGSVDPEGTLSSIVCSFYPECDEPYRLLEHLINTGLAKLTEGEKQPDPYKIMFG